MALDDDGFKNAYLTKLRVMIRQNSDIMREFTEDLHHFAYGYNAQLQAQGEGVDHFAPGAQDFLEAWDALRQDWDVWVGQIAFADVLELQAMWNNREIWARRLDKLPMIPPPRHGDVVQLRAFPVNGGARSTRGWLVGVPLAPATTPPPLAGVDDGAACASLLDVASALSLAGFVTSIP